MAWCQGFSSVSHDWSHITLGHSEYSDFGSGSDRRKVLQLCLVSDLLAGQQVFQRSGAFRSQHTRLEATGSISYYLGRHQIWQLR